MNHLVLEVRVVLENSPLVGPCPNIVLHHVLLLGEVAIKLRTEGKKKGKRSRSETTDRRMFTLLCSSGSSGSSDTVTSVTGATQECV